MFCQLGPLEIVVSRVVPLVDATGAVVLSLISPSSRGAVVVGDEAREVVAAMLGVVWAEAHG